MKINTYKSLILVFLISCGSAVTQKSLPEIPQKEVIPQYVEPPQTKSEEDATVHIGDRLPVKGVTRKPISDKTFVIIVGAVIVLSIMAGGYIVSKSKGGKSEKVKAASDAVASGVDTVLNTDVSTVEKVIFKDIPTSDVIADLLRQKTSKSLINKEEVLISVLADLYALGVYSPKEIEIALQKLKLSDVKTLRVTKYSTIIPQALNRLESYVAQDAFLSNTLTDKLKKIALSFSGDMEELIRNIILILKRA